MPKHGVITLRRIDDQGGVTVNYPHLLLGYYNRYWNDGEAVEITDLRPLQYPIHTDYESMLHAGSNGPLIPLVLPYVAITGLRDATRHQFGTITPGTPEVPEIPGNDAAIVGLVGGFQDFGGNAIVQMEMKDQNGNSVPYQMWSEWLDIEYQVTYQGGQSFQTTVSIPAWNASTGNFVEWNFDAIYNGDMDNPVSGFAIIAVNSDWYSNVAGQPTKLQVLAEPGTPGTPGTPDTYNPPFFKYVVVYEIQ